MGQLINADPLSSNTARHQSMDISPESLSCLVNIIEALREAGYDPFNQLTGYIQTGDECYITRHGNARNLILKLDIKDIKVYLAFNKCRTV